MKHLFNELDNQIRELLQQELSKIFEDRPITSITTAPEKKILDIDEFCDYTGLAKQTVYKKTGKGLIPHAKRGKRLYFDKEEIDKWLLEHKVKPISEIATNYRKFTHRRRR
jgi:excisionase family DNA binding protein